MRYAAYPFIIYGFIHAFALPISAAASARVCQIDLLCMDAEICEEAPDDAVLQLQIGESAADVMIEGDTETFARVAAEIEGMQSFLGSDPDGSGTILLSLHEGGEIIMSIHGRLFGPFAVTAFGSCTEVAE